MIKKLTIWTFNDRLLMSLGKSNGIPITFTYLIQNKSHEGTLHNPNVVCQASSPSCGDMITLHASIDNGIITAVRFQGQGCVIAVGMAAILAEFASNKELSCVLALDADRIKQLLGIDIGPVRMRCALLSLDALKSGIESYKK